MSPNSQHAAPSVTTADLVKRAAALAPKLRERITAGAMARRVPSDTMADLVASGVLKACMPARWGGHELPFGHARRVVHAKHGITGK